MSVTLAPIVSQKLTEFRRRRFRFIVTRGFCAGIITFLLGMSLVAAIDWYWLLSEQTRWYLSGSAYASVAIVIWMTSLRRMLHLPALEEIASQIELTEPQLREKLLSAVELVTDDSSTIHDSPVFRGLLQGDVAEQMGHVRVQKLLPLKLVAKWTVLAVVLLGLTSLLLSSSDPRYRQLALRAALPGANLARVSRIHVEILKPTPHSFLLAEDETVAVHVAVSGGRVKDVTLETFSAHQGAVRQFMRGQTDSEFIANIHIADEAVEYRILAGDAITQRFRIDSRPRPRVTSFVKTFSYPTYTQLAEETKSETNGDLVALQGTQVELVMELDQAVSVAEIRVIKADTDETVVVPLTRVESSGKSSTGPPVATSGQHWKGTLPIEEAAVYKVHLVSQETGFENLFSPKYEIRPEPDLIPRTGFVDQQETTLLLPPNDLLALKGMAEDDLPVVSLEQQISINGQDWETVRLEVQPSDNNAGRRVFAAWDWDLLHLKLKTGDQVLTKLVATDLKGNMGESIPLRIVVAAQDFDPSRHALMERKASLADELVPFADLLEEHKVSALEVIEKMQQAERTENELNIDRTTLLDLSRKQREQAGYLYTKILDVAREMPAGADAYELDLTGQVISRIQLEHTHLPAMLLAILQLPAPENQIKNDYQELKRTFERTADDARNVANHYQHFVAHNFLASVAFDLDAILRQQKLIVDSPTQSWDRLLRQETIVINQMRVLERHLRDQQRRLPRSFEGHITNLLRWADSQRQRIQDHTESSDQLPQLQRISGEFLRELEHKQNYDNIEGGLPRHLTNARRDFEQRAGSLYVSIEQTARTIQQENRVTAQASASPDSAESRKLLLQAQRFVSEIELKQRRSLDQLRNRRELTQSRTDTDAQYAADAGLTLRATTSLLNQHRQTPPQESMIADALLEIAPAYRILEAGHHFQNVSKAVENLLNLERWNAQTIQGRLDHPRQWDVVNQGFESTSQRLREAGITHELVGQLDQLRWSSAVRDAGRKIGERRWKRDAMIGAGHELVEIRENLAQVERVLQPILADARKIIAKYAPTIPQMAQQSAEQLRVLEEQTIAAAETIEQSPSPPEPSQDPQTSQQEQRQQQEKNQQLVSELSQQQESIQRQIEDLVEALIEDANSQDLLDQEQRERARDADDSIALIQSPAQQMERALEQAKQNPSPMNQAQDLAQTAEQQEKTAQALELVAKHFDRLNEGLEVAETREDLRQAERELGIARQMEQRFENAQQLSQLANQETQDLLAQLDEELQKNPAMQQALSEIARNTLQEARNALEFAAADDQQLQRANERSDTKFQNQKKELAEELRKMGNFAAQLSQQLLSQANQSAVQGKTPEAQQKLTEAQQKLNEIAANANQAREEQLLSDLAQTATQAQQALKSATETLAQAKQETARGKEEKIHEDDKKREDQKKDSERRRQQFHEQQKRTAREETRRAEDTQKRADQNLKNSQNQEKSVERQRQQAQDQLNKKPEDANLKRNLEQAQARLQTEQDKVNAARESLKKSEMLTQLARQQEEQIKRKSPPPLNAPNPATQLADQYTEEALAVAEELNRKAEQLVAAAQFGKELQPSRGELANSEQRQGEITQDVQQTAEDVARAARHERRLQNVAIAEPLQQTARAIEQVARNEAKSAQQKLNEAVSEAQAREDSPNQPRQNEQGLQAQSDLSRSENAIAQQAQKLSEVLEPVLAAEQALAQAALTPNPAQEPGTDTSSPSGTLTEGSSAPAAGQAPGEGQLQTSVNAPGANSPQMTPEQLARGAQLAKLLDELDRQQAAANASTTPPGEGTAPPSPTTGRPLDSLAQAAAAQQASLANARAQAQQTASTTASNPANESLGIPATTGAQSDFIVSSVNRDENANWGKLRGKSAEDLSKGQSEAVSEEYRKSVETYFRVLAERARNKK